jgi:signal transduction histidine kinase
MCCRPFSHVLCSIREISRRCEPLDRHPRSEGRAPLRGQEIRITVEDKGIGIAREDLKKIFKPFYRSPAVTAEQIHGSGLGLALAKTIAEGMGGSLTVQSVPQKGSVFTVHLPIKEDFPPGDHLSSTPQGNSIS